MCEHSLRYFQRSVPALRLYGSTHTGSNQEYLRFYPIAHIIASSLSSLLLAAVCLSICALHEQSGDSIAEVQVDVVIMLRSVPSSQQQAASGKHTQVSHLRHSSLVLPPSTQWRLAHADLGATCQSWHSVPGNQITILERGTDHPISPLHSVIMRVGMCAADRREKRRP